MLNLKGHRHWQRYTLKPRNILYRLWIVFICICAVQFLQWHVSARDSLEAKYTATRFGDEEILLARYATSSERSRLQARTALLAARPHWKTLGSGFEGTTSVWNGSVVKTFYAEHSPLRNCIPSKLAASLMLDSRDVGTCRLLWPAEIPAALLLSGAEGFVPLEDFFLVGQSASEEPQWHLVMPLMQGGTLSTLADRIRNTGVMGDLPRELDMVFRPKFDGFLGALQEMHELGFCHDDVRAKNVFINSTGSATDGAWLLGDFGNVREIAHPYHSSPLWANEQLSDCRANDALRAMKTYLQFLRQASAPREDVGPSSDFDIALFAAREPWARFFWRAVDASSNLRVEEVLQWSRNSEHPTASAHYLSTMQRQPLGSLGTLLSRLSVDVHRRAAITALRISASEGWSRAFALTWILGVPSRGC